MRLFREFMDDAFSPIVDTRSGMAFDPSDKSLSLLEKASRLPPVTQLDKATPEALDESAALS